MMPVALERESVVAKSILTGLQASWRRHRYFADDTRKIRPEYLSTVSIAEELLRLPEEAQGTNDTNPPSRLF